MKILQIVNSLSSGGAEKLVVDTSIRFQQKGHDVTILLLNGTTTPLYNKIKEIPEITIKAIAIDKNIYNPINILKIKTLISKYDIIQTHLFPTFYWVAFAQLISLKKKKIIFTEHNTTNRRRSKSIFKFLDKIVYRQFTKIITISDAVDNNLRKHLGGEFNKIDKIYNGIDLEVINNAKPYNVSQFNCHTNQTLIMQVASFTTQKDQNSLIRSLKHLPESFVLLLVGDGPLIKDSKALSKELNLNNRIQFLGIRDDVPSLLKTVDIVVLSSHYEGLSLSCIEGMASGKPFIASNTPGLGDIVKNAGLIFDDNNDVKLAQHIKTLSEDPQLYQNIVKSCQQRAKIFDINIMVDKYIKLYEQIYSY
ncbi:Glycosyltransferase involved in cell wall bisynthesis [Algibacter lectus]|uniref:glycosyltransferase n=1 Tax=Algibacter lectus TaxID=221126 RepID=UPI0008EEA92D|nr:glycosyltransferase [Algibacter lectus]SFC35621.1 Glycosyltransferase involved in cell wall bisynthesis [Algibacter lectus]